MRIFLLPSITTTAIALLAASGLISSNPLPEEGQHSIQARDPAYKVHINGPRDSCLILPRQKRMSVGASEGDKSLMQSFCDVPRSGQGQLPSNFWKNPHYKKTSSWVQITGCINPNAGGRLDPNDGGGQYDSSGGDGGLGNPRGSKCTGYNHYVELVEPDVGRACIRCCQNYNDCRLDRDTSGCPAVIPGDYSC